MDDPRPRRQDIVRSAPRPDDDLVLAVEQLRRLADQVEDTSQQIARHPTLSFVGPGMRLTAATIQIRGVADEVFDAIINERNAKMAGTPHYQIFPGEGGQFYWRFRGANGEIQAIGGEPFPSAAAAEEAIDRLHETLTEKKWPVHRVHSL